MVFALCTASAVTFADGEFAPAPDAEVGRDRLHAAVVAAPFELREGASLSYFSTSAFPHPGVAHAQTAGRLAASLALPGAEVFAAVGFTANRDELTAPHLILAVGDLSLGAKVARPLGGGLSLGGALTAELPAGVGSVSVAPAAVGGQAAAFGLWRGAAGSVPLAVAAELSLSLDRTEALLPTDPAPTIEQEYALGATRFAVVGVGLWVSARPWRALAPFVELRLDAPLGAGAALSDSTTGAVVSYAAASAWRATPGLRWEPLAGLSFEGAVELGTGGAAIRGYAPAPPWEARFALTYAFDPRRAHGTPLPLPAPMPMLVESAPATGWIEGVVVAENEAPVAGVEIHLPGVNRPPVATGDDGRFRTYALPPGSVALIARKAGYLAATGRVNVAAGQAVGARLTLTAEPPPAPTATLAVRVSDELGEPLSAQVRVTGAAMRDGLTRRETGTWLAEGLAPGKLAVTALASGRLARRREVTVAGGAAAALELTLPRAPTPRAVELEMGLVKIARPIAFEGDAVAPGAAALVDEIADALLRSDAGVVVAGPAARARALAQALVARGVRATPKAEAGTLELRVAP